MGRLIIYLLSAVILIAIVIIALNYSRSLRNQDEESVEENETLDDAVNMIFSNAINDEQQELESVVEETEGPTVEEESKDEEKMEPVDNSEDKIAEIYDTVAELCAKYEHQIAAIKAEHGKEIKQYKNIIKELGKQNEELIKMLEDERFNHTMERYQVEPEYEEELVELDLDIKPGHKKSAQAVNGKLIFEEKGVVNLKLVMKEIIPMLQEVCESAEVGLSVKFGELRHHIVYADSADLNAMILDLVTKASKGARKNSSIILNVNQVGLEKYGYADYEFTCSYVGNRIDFDESVVQNMGGEFSESSYNNGNNVVVAKFRFEIR